MALQSRIMGLPDLGGFHGMDLTADVSAREWPLQRLLALRAFEARAWRRRQARIGALDDDAYERGRAFQAYEDLLAELA